MSEKKIILFDGVCNLCNNWVNWVIKKDSKQVFLFCSLQSPTGQKIWNQIKGDKKYLDTVVLIEGSKIYIKSTAALRICSSLITPYNWLFVFISIPKFIRNFFYDFIARNRYRWFGKKDQCMIPSPELKKRFLD